MTKLNLLGAQRVKALTEILERRYKDKISELNANRMSEEDAAWIYAERHGEEKLLHDIQQKVEDLKHLKPSAINKLGIEINVSVDYYSYRAEPDTRKAIIMIRDHDTDKKIEALKRELGDKKSKLWLVETLEEAQEIVDSEIGKYE